MKKEMRLEAKINLGNYENITISMTEEFVKEDNWDVVKTKMMDEFKKQADIVVAEWKAHRDEVNRKDPF